MVAQRPRARRSRAGGGCREGCPLPATGSGGGTPGKFLKFYTQNRAFWFTFEEQGDQRLDSRLLCILDEISISIDFLKTGLLLVNIDIFSKWSQSREHGVNQCEILFHSNGNIIWSKHGRTLDLVLGNLAWLGGGGKGLKKISKSLRRTLDRQNGP